MTHSPLIERIDTVRAYYSGPRLVAEVDIVIDRNERLEVAHDIAEELQVKLEKLPSIERAFVHIDYETSHKPVSCYLHPVSKSLGNLTVSYRNMSINSRSCFKVLVGIVEILASLSDWSHVPSEARAAINECSACEIKRGYSCELPKGKMVTDEKIDHSFVETILHLDFSNKQHRSSNVYSPSATRLKQTFRLRAQDPLHIT